MTDRDAEIIAVAREGFDRLHAKLDAIDAIQADCRAIMDRMLADIEATLAALRDTPSGDA